MSISATVIKDSISPYGHRITTFVLEFPKNLQAELNTHRVHSRNSASSRAIPFKKMVEAVIADPVIPLRWGSQIAGMQVGEDLPPDKIEACKQIWFEARDKAIEFATKLNELGLHKSISNRIIEPWFTTKVILTGTEFENFFELRCHKDAEPSMQDLAKKMLVAYNESTPEHVGFNGWHIPFGDNIDDARILETKAWKERAVDLKPDTMEYALALLDFRIRIATARCARISYLTFEGKNDYDADLVLCDKLFGSTPRHLSPTEHCAFAMREERFDKNFFGWRQYRSVLEEKGKEKPDVKAQVSSPAVKAEPIAE